MKSRLKTTILTVVLLYVLARLIFLMSGINPTIAETPLNLVITGEVEPDGSGGYQINARVLEATYPPSASNTPPKTPTPSLTPTDTAAPTAIPPTQETTPPPPPTPGEGKTCELKINQVIRVRTGPGTEYDPVLPSLSQGAIIEISQFSQGQNYLWAKHARGWSAVYTGNIWWADGITGTTDVCPDVSGWPAGLSPPAPIVAAPRVGPHALYSINRDKARAHYPDWGTFKATNGAEDVLREYKAARPDGITVYRSYLNVYYGETDCPPGTNAAAIDTWMGGLIPHWAKTNGADYFEFQNECDHFSPDQQIEANINAMKWANTRGYCLLLFSFGPGNPTGNFWEAAAPPVLDYALNHPCGEWPDGSIKYHQVALHYYSIDAPLMDYYLFERYRWQYLALDRRLWRIGVFFTEWGVDTGHLYDHPDGLDCDKLKEALARAIPFYESDGIGVVRGLHIWSFGPGPWPNAGRCQLWGPP